MWRLRLLQAFPDRDVGRCRVSVNVLGIAANEAGIVHLFSGQESAAIVGAPSQSRQIRWTAAHSQLLDASPALSEHSEAEASNLWVARRIASGRAADAPRRFLQRTKRRRPSAGVCACPRACVLCLMALVLTNLLCAIRRCSITVHPTGRLNQKGSTRSNSFFRMGCPKTAGSVRAVLL